LKSDKETKNIHNRQNDRISGLLKDEIVLPEDFAELDEETTDLFNAELHY
jgi:hypothetical protein